MECHPAKKISEKRLKLPKNNVFLMVLSSPKKESHDL